MARVEKGQNIATGQCKEGEGGWRGVDKKAGLEVLGDTAEV